MDLGITFELHSLNLGQGYLVHDLVSQLNLTNQGLAL